MWISTLTARCIPCKSFKIFNLYRYRYQSKVYKLVHPLFKLMCVTGHVCRRACPAPFFTIPHLCYLFIFNDYSASFPVTELNRLRRQLFCTTFSSAVLITLPHYSSPSAVPHPTGNLKAVQDYNILSLSLSLSLCVSLSSSTLWFSKSICHWRLKRFSECFAQPSRPPFGSHLLPTGRGIANGKLIMSSLWFMYR